MEQPVRAEMTAEKQNTYAELAAINVNDHVEKKNNLSYLSWPWAVDQLMRIDPDADWLFREWDGVPVMTLPNGTAMVHCAVTIRGKTRGTFLPVMDHRNKPIQNPDSFAINTALQRCLVKAIGMHGLGLYIYAGEDLPPSIEGEKTPDPTPWTAELSDLAADAAKRGGKEYREFWKGLREETRSVLVQTKEHADFKAQAKEVDDLRASQEKQAA